MIASTLACAFLSSCGMVVSTQPLFNPSETSHFQPRPGLWAFAEPGCHFNTRSSPTTWPDCAQALSVHDGLAVNAKVKPKAPKGPMDAPIPFTLAAGTPGVIQVARPINKDFTRWGHGYFGFRPLATDEEGRVVSARLWPAFCHRPDPQRRPTKDCWTPSASDVRLALKDSEIWVYENHLSDLGLTAVWVRYDDPPNP